MREREKKTYISKNNNFSNSYRTNNSDCSEKYVNIRRRRSDVTPGDAKKKRVMITPKQQQKLRSLKVNDGLDWTLDSLKC